MDNEKRLRVSVDVSQLRSVGRDIENMQRRIVENNNDIIRNSFVLQIFCSFSSYFLLSVILFVCQKEAMICRKKTT